MGLHLAKQEVVCAVSKGGGDLDAFGVYVWLPGVVFLCWIKHMADELATMPSKVADIFPCEQHQACFVRQYFRQDKTCAMRHDGRVRSQRDRLHAIEMVVARRYRYGAIFGKERGEFGRVVGTSQRDQSEKQKWDPFYHDWILTS